MKLEFIADAADGPTLLLYGPNSEEVVQLRNALCQLAEWPGRKLSVHELPYVEALAQCELLAICGSRDIGVRKTSESESPSFEWILAPPSWSNVEALLEPFCALTSGTQFQFLNPAFGPEVIYSTQRR